MSSHHSTSGALNRRTLLSCSHCMVTGNHWQYQTAKSWFRSFLTYCNTTFEPPHSESHKPWHGSFASRRLSRLPLQYHYLPSAMFTQNMTVQDYCLQVTLRTILLDRIWWHVREMLASTMLSFSLASHHPVLRGQCFLPLSKHAMRYRLY